jgi:hypothetical protein
MRCLPTFWKRAEACYLLFLYKNSALQRTFIIDKHLIYGVVQRWIFQDYRGNCKTCKIDHSEGDRLQNNNCNWKLYCNYTMLFWSQSQENLKWYRKHHARDTLGFAIVSIVLQLPLQIDEYNT